MNKKKMTFLAVILAVIGIVSIIGGAYAFFAYNKEGTVENIATTGKITFKYDETSVRGINLVKAMPIYDRQGLALDEEGEYFDFEVSTNGTDQILEYKIELAMTEDSNLPEKAIKVALFRIVDGKEEIVSSSIAQGKIKTYDKYQLNNDNGTRIIETEYFEVSDESEVRNYRLKVWLDKDLDFSPLKNEDGTYKTDEEGNYIYPYNNKNFKVRVNVSAESWPYESLGDPAPEPSCNSTYCDQGSTITLPDGSTWKLVKPFVSGEGTITLLSDKYISEEGNYVDTPNNLVAADVETRLNNFSAKLKQALSDDNIIVSLPSAEILNIEYFDSTYKDAYIIEDSRGNLFDSLYILSDYINTYYNSDTTIEYSYWYVNNNKIDAQASGRGTNLDLDGDGLPEHILYESMVKPVITISKNYLPQ